MKTLYLVLSLIFSVLILILAFGNISASCSNLHFLFFPVDSNPTIISLSIAVLGLITGALYHAFITRVLEVSEEDTDQAF